MNGILELAHLIELVSGNVLPSREHNRLLELAERRRQATGQRDLDGYLRLLRLDLNGPEWRHLLSRITINESYLFRAPQQFRAVAEVMIPDLVAQRRPGDCLRLWSAGCARGEEAVTLAITCAESKHLSGWPWQIVATDVDEAALEDARRGRFGQRAVAKVPDHLLERYFEPRGTDYELDPGLAQHITFQPCNLVERAYTLGAGSFDIIFLRNVLIYFRTEVQRRVVTSVASMLAEDGYLCLGPSESLWQLTRELKAVDLGDCFCYRHAAAQTRPEAAPPVQRPDPAPPPAMLPVAVLPTRVAPAEVPPDAKPIPAGAGQPLRTRVVIPIVEALGQGRTEQAQELLRESTMQYPESPVLRALEGLACDMQHLTDAALKAYRAALYLDPALFQVRYLLAQCMERLGWQQRAVREYREVLACLVNGEPHDLEDWAVLGLPSRAQIQISCTRTLDQEGC